ncbi:protein kinase [Gordonia desulfuricans]|uniref:Protein kinase n=1 Tax=Gordonia desulfuricans TaxID=89051 RepID=A0A7K3LSI2_9ACTN|nr:protein kinase [Gordonia desulfuricans]NDK90971.1 protein kinase [Gordonia desulfuricans]
MSSLEPGSVFAGYRVIGLLGAGGMGQVYLVEHPALGRREALKIVSPTGDADFGERFTNEARTAASLDHPGIVTVYAYGVENGSAWFTMRYLDGADLGGSGALPPKDVDHIVTRAAEALDYAHGRRVIHRDIKPANIVITRDEQGHPDRVTVLDFGIARLIDAPKMTATNAFIGTLTYAAPETLSGAPADPASDQYALACTAFELLTGTAPFRGDTPGALITGHVTGPVPRIGERAPMLAGLDPVFVRALAKNPADRFGSCREFAAALGAASAGLPPVAATAVGGPSGPRGTQTFTPPPIQGIPPAQGLPPVQAIPPVQSVPPGAPLSSTPGMAPYPGTVRPAWQTPPPHQPYGPPSGPTPPTGGSKNRTGLIVGAVAGVLVLLAAITGIAVWAANSGGSDTHADDTTVVDPSTSGAPTSGAPTDSTTVAAGEWASIATDGQSSCALRDGSVYCWGSNDRGTLGDGTTTSHSTPTRIPGLSDVTAIAMGGLGSACAISDGDVFCWGANLVGGAPSEYHSPTRVDGVTDASAISVGLATCAISNGDLYCWGNNVYGQTGDPAATGFQKTPTKVSGLNDVRAVSANTNNTCAVTGDGAAWCWGKNDQGQVGDGTTTVRKTPTRVSGLTGVSAIDTGLDSMCAIADGTPWCWGNNGSGQLGNGTEQSSSTPVRVGGVSGARAIATVISGACASTGAGDVWCWGSRSSASNHTAAQVSGIRGVTDLTSGSVNLCAVGSSQLYCWGLNSQGQLGDGSTDSSINEPVRVREPA